MVGGSVSKEKHRTSDAASNREMLFPKPKSTKSTSSKGRSTTKKNSLRENNASAAEEAKSITDSLLRTKSMMKQELERVSEVSQAIDSDGQILNEATTEHKGLDNVVKNARGVLGVLKRQDMQDSVVLWSAFTFFLISSLYVLWTRIRIPFLLW